MKQWVIVIVTLALVLGSFSIYTKGQYIHSPVGKWTFMSQQCHPEQASKNANECEKSQ